ncbi:MAG TPA: serine/threonine-protein kinase [Verrucomicrobiota bacterium]|nr:serine/threonine-protein kinase [Verrucomicrobiota bacterium]
MGEEHEWGAPLGAFGDYELIEEIARGGMGVVYRARQLSLNRVVAVKTILAGEFATPEFIRRFRAEAAAAAVLHHPNIVAIHEVGIHAGRHFFSMDLVEGPSLATLVGHVPLPAKRAARYVNAIAKAVHYAHENGILHRDLKPSNVLIDADDQPRITDFGLAKRLEGETGLTVSGHLVGSPNFMPPEQASAEHGKVGRPSDVYALGGILYYLLTARPPFQADSIEAVVSHLLTIEPVSPRLLNHSVPRDLETICLKCLEKEPGRRYPTAAALAEELDRFLAGKPIQARPIGLIGKVWRWARRNPLPAGLALALALVCAAGFGGVVWQWRKARERLWESYVAQAHANRWSGRAGRRFNSLEVLRRAAAMRPSMELRNEAIACLTLSDGREGKTWPTATNTAAVFDPECQRYASWNPTEGLAIVRVADGAELLRLSDREETAGRRWLSFSPNGELLAAASTDSERSRVRVWDLPRRAVRYDTVLEAARPTLAFSPDSRLLVAGDKHGGRPRL